MLDGSLAGRVFEDLNGNQRWEPNAPHFEPALECWQVYVDENNNGNQDNGELTRHTAADGTYRFDGLAPGNYTVNLVQEPGYDRTRPIRFGESTALVSATARDHVFDATGNVLYVTSGDRILRRDAKTGATLASLAVGNSLTGIDITPDGKYLVVGEGQVDIANSLGFIHRIEIATGAVATASYPINLLEDGVFDVAAVSNSRVLFTSSSSVPNRVPLRELDVTTNQVVSRSDTFNGGAGLVRPNSRLERNNGRDIALLLEAQEVTGPVYLYDPSTNSFPRSAQLNGMLDHAHVGISHDGGLIAVETSTLGLQILNDQFGIVATPIHFRGGVAFDPVRDILYAGDTVNDEIVALNTSSWTELYRVATGEDLVAASTYFEMQTNARAKFLSFTTSSGVRYLQLDRPVGYSVTVIDNQLVQNLDFGNWWNGTNRRPRAVSDSYAVSEEGLLSVSAPGILGNDSDPDQNPITATNVTLPQNGFLTISNNGSFTYEPFADFFGPDSFTYFAHDGSLASCRAATVNINVAPVNDPPTDISVSDTSVDENDAGAEIGDVVVADIDPGDTHTYTVSDSRFEVVNNRLRLKIGVSLDYEAASEILLTITASDTGIPPGTVSRDFTITVNDVNEYTPTIDTPSIDTDEGTTTVGTIETTDLDTDQTVTLEILAGNDTGIFALDPHTGVITVVNGHTLDHEGTAIYVLTVQATDDVQPTRSSTADVTIHVNDVNEFDPELQPQTVTIPEDTATGTVIATVTGTDADTSQTLTYSITGGNSGNAFAIDSSTGAITVADNSAIDFETIQQFTLSVTATDDGSPRRSATTTVTVDITDVNEFDPTILDQSFDVAENTDVGFIVGTVAALDKDSAQTLTFEISGGNTGNTFEIDVSTGVITVLDSTLLDFETTSQFDLAVTVTDSGSPQRSSTATVTIRVLDVNEFSPETGDVTVELDENTPTIGTVSGTDADRDQVITFSLFGAGPDSVFEIDALSGEIRVASGKTLDYEDSQQHILTVKVSDSGSPAFSSFATVTVNVRDINEFAPTVSDQTFTVFENPPNDFSVGAVQATDQDYFQSLNFAITAGNELDVFEIDPTTGAISVRDGSLIDRESVSRFDLTVEVTDSGEPGKSSTGTVTILVDDVNEFPVEIDNQSFDVPENSANGTVVGMIAVQDQDAAGTYAFNIISGNTGGAFAVDSNGKLTVANVSELDFETTAQFTLVVEISETASVGNSDSAEITVNLLDVNEADPVVADQTFRLIENASLGTVVGTMTATDADLSQSVSYSITSGNQSGAFAIHSTSGQITVANSSLLDYESVSVFVLTVTATDSGSPSRSDSAEVTIELDDENESAPTLNNQSFELDEDATNGTLVGIVAASDPEDGHTLAYAILSGNTDNAFAIDSATGRLTVANASALDSETRARFRLTVQVVDSGNPPLSDTGTITIDVQDVNEPPTGIQLSGGEVQEHVDGASIGTVTVIDQDLNDQHTLSVDDGRFEITAQRELKLRDGQALDADADGDVTVNITATDLAGNSLTTVFVIHVISNDVPWQNPVNVYDVNGDGTISPLDALNVINEINNPKHSDPAGQLPTARPDDPNAPYYDVNGDGHVTAIDALIIINKLNRGGGSASGGEGEGFGSAASISAPWQDAATDREEYTADVPMGAAPTGWQIVPVAAPSTGARNRDADDTATELDNVLDDFAEEIAQLWAAVRQ